MYMKIYFFKKTNAILLRSIAKDPQIFTARQYFLSKSLRGGYIPYAP